MTETYSTATLSWVQDFVSVLFSTVKEMAKTDSLASLAPQSLTAIDLNLTHIAVAFFRYLPVL
jgi:hypothetical protein